MSSSTFFDQLTTLSNHFFQMSNRALCRADCIFRILVHIKATRTGQSDGFGMDDEEKALLKSLGVDESILEAPIPLHASDPSSALWRDGFAAAATATVGAALAFNVAILLSLPSVLRGRGAPYLPSQRRSMDSMFQFLRSQPEIRPILEQSQQQRHPMLTGARTRAATIEPSSTSNREFSGDGRLKFVDLGSGDGRWVFRAAQDHPDLFRVSVGYEINPLLHLYASARRVLRGAFRWFSMRPSSDAAPHCSTELHRHDLWTVPLDDANVVAVVCAVRLCLCSTRLTHVAPHNTSLHIAVRARPYHEGIGRQARAGAPARILRAVQRLFGSWMGACRGVECEHDGRIVHLLHLQNAATAFAAFFNLTRWLNLFVLTVKAYQYLVKLLYKGNAGYLF
jgi:hypothetical protein